MKILFAFVIFLGNLLCGHILWPTDAFVPSLSSSTVEKLRSVKNICSYRQQLSPCRHGQRQKRQLMFHVSFKDPTRLASSLEDDIGVRDWMDGEENIIVGLLEGCSGSSSMAQSGTNPFDPEGPLYIDCADAQTIRESYNAQDGGCMLVATDRRKEDSTDDASNNILGTAGLIIGTPVTYLKSGASISTATITAAARRICAAGNINAVAQETIFRALLREIEERAILGGATELIILAYPENCGRPNAALLEKLGYAELTANLDGVNAIQYSKHLSSSSSIQDGIESDTAGTGIANGKDSVNMTDAIFGVSFIALLLLATLAVGNFMGLELFPSTDNRGIGTPLSIEELQLLEQDEQLKRTDLDAISGGYERQWKDLNMEERREEAALMKIIQGQDVRLQ